MKALREYGLVEEIPNDAILSRVGTARVMGHEIPNDAIFIAFVEDGGFRFKWKPIVLTEN